MVQRLISFDDEKPDLGLPDDVQARMDARYSGSGPAPHIGENGNWWIGDTDTGVPAQGPQGDDGATPEIIDGTWWIGDDPTGVPATGEKGDPGEAPPRSSRLLLHTGTGDPVLTDFPDAQVGDLIERTTDGARWRIDA